MKARDANHIPSNSQLSLLSANVDSPLTKVERALRGEILYGDDFNSEEIEQWFDDEREGYFNLYYGKDNPEGLKNAKYEYSELAEQHCFRWLKDRKFSNALGIGSAHGAELKPVLDRSDQVTILEPSDGFSSTHIDGKPVKYVKPASSGIMPFQGDQFDIAVCFSVLHHIPNVSTVIKEMYRVLKPGGFALLREPVHSMGDWRTPRRGLTKRERGIPLPIFKTIITESGFVIEKETLCIFSLMSRITPLFGIRSPWTSKIIVDADRVICALPIWPRKYGAQRAWHKIRPTSVSFVLKRPL